MVAYQESVVIFECDCNRTGHCFPCPVQPTQASNHAENLNTSSGCTSACIGPIHLTGTSDLPWLAGLNLPSNSGVLVPAAGATFFLLPALLFMIETSRSSRISAIAAIGC